MYRRDKQKLWAQNLKDEKFAALLQQWDTIIIIGFAK